MSTLPERLRLLPAGLVMPDLAAVRDQDATVENHIARRRRDENGYEVRHEPRNQGRSTTIVVGPIGGPVMLPEM
jgi:hypothetical protein